ncbi:hypothetical protein NL676_019657 [Syzygium grande]|nr:hypothetical protein NL676_019657 [Syzygium grande]
MKRPYPVELLAYLRLHAEANPPPPVDHQIDLRTFSLSMTLPTWQNLGSNIAAAPAHLSTLPFLAPTSPSSLLINHHRRLVEHEEREMLPFQSQVLFAVTRCSVVAVLSLSLFR